MKRRGAPMAWTWLNETELRNAVRLHVFRKQIIPSDAAEILHKQALGLQNGVYSPAVPALADVNRETERLGALHTATMGTRTLDILHFAQVLVLGLKEFPTFDERQPKLAKAAGLKVPKP
jgi:hypothetical protein